MSVQTMGKNTPTSGKTGSHMEKIRLVSPVTDGLRFSCELHEVERAL